MYIIRVKNYRETTYVAVDSATDHSLYFTANVVKAKVFSTKLEAVEYLRIKVDAKSTQTTDGKVWPNSFLHNASGVCREHTADSVVFTVIKLELVSTEVSITKTVRIPK